MSELAKSQKAGYKLEKAIMVVAVITLLIALLVPLIIWDALGSGAMHFMRYGHVSVAGSSAGDSKATFFFGIPYFIANMGPGNFIPAQLFSAQWRVVLETTEASVLADNLGAVTMVLTVLLFVTQIVMIIVYAVDRRIKGNGIFNKIAKIVSGACAGIELVTVIWFGIILVSMLTKINNYSFRIYDFAAYGGVKFLLEVILCLVLFIMNTLLFFKLQKK